MGEGEAFSSSGLYVEAPPGRGSFFTLEAFRGAFQNFSMHRASRYVKGMPFFYGRYYEKE